jgi:CheY-like chemotaxis protein
MQEPVEARILLVSSDPEHVRRHADRLSGVGYVVRACEPDADGFSLVDEFNPQVTVVDLSAGNRDAVDFLERGRRNYPACGFLGLSEPVDPPVEAPGDPPGGPRGERRGAPR